MGKRTPGQLPLDAATPRRKGTVERAAELDLRELRKAKSIPDGMKAIEAAYRLTAREFDRAEEEREGWKKLNSARELRALRERLGVVAPAPADGEAEAFWRDLGPDATAPGPTAAGDTPPT